jgi:hypothetical protein
MTSQPNGRLSAAADLGAKQLRGTLYISLDVDKEAS